MSSKPHIAVPAGSPAASSNRRRYRGNVRTPRIAVITPTKDRCALLTETITSVRSQTYTDWEHWIIDDGSTDGTEETVANISAEDPRIRYLKRTSDITGASVCRNIGVRATTAELVVFLDSDDLLDNHCLERRAQLMERNPDLDFATFQSALFLNKKTDLGRIYDGELLGDDLLRFLFFEVPWVITAPVWRRSTLLRLGLFDESLPSWQDVDLHIRAIVSRCKYLRFPEVDHHIRWQYEATKVSVEQRRSPKHLEAALLLLKKFEHLVNTNASMNWVRQRALCGLYFFVAERWVENKALGKALSAWRVIFRRRLGSGFLWLTGTLVLCLYRMPDPGGIVARVVNKWKGWMRLRTNPALLKSLNGQQLG